jgi:hypothetical protein
MDIELKGMDAVAQKIAHMQETIKKLPDDMETELFNWQAEDMHRRNPGVKRQGKRRRSTIVRPHSLGEMMHRFRAKRKQAMRQRRRKRRRHGRVYQRTSSRPVLRDELLTRFYERGTQLLRKVKWQ